MPTSYCRSVKRFKILIDEMRTSLYCKYLVIFEGNDVMQVLLCNSFSNVLIDDLSSEAKLVNKQNKITSYVVEVSGE